MRTARFTVAPLWIGPAGVVRETGGGLGAVILASLVLVSCAGSPPEQRGPDNQTDRLVAFVPQEVVDLGTLVTEDLAERVAGKKILADSGFTEPNRFDPTRWEMELPGGTASGQNSYYTLYSHAGPHVDAPNHVGLPGGLDSYPLSAFSGPVKVFDVSGFPLGFSVTKEYFEDKEISSGDVVLIYTAYKPPSDEESWPRVVTLTREAAEYLADIPVRAFGTDAASVFDPTEPPVVEGGSVTAQVAPIHESFLSRQIPVYEGLFNVDALLQDRRMFFVGVPLNIPEGDGMPVRPVVLVY